MNDKNTEIRVAVALVALRFKPTRQSYISYTLDLRDVFPCPGGDVQPKENMLVSQGWKERALELETHCIKLERMFEWDQLERLVETSSEGRATVDQGKKREKKRDKAENRPWAGLERVLHGKVVGHNLDGPITISSRSALTIYERLMRAQSGLLTRSLTDSAAERERFSLTVIPVTFSVARSGLEELGKMVQVMTDVGRNSREIRDVFGTIAWMLQGILQSAFAVAQRFTKATGLRAKQVRQLEKLVEEECDRTLGALSEMVLLRLVRFIYPLMERMFENSEHTTDTPMGLIGVLEGALETVEQSGFTVGVMGVKERVALGVCQELVGLSRRIPVDGGSKPVQERKRKLAKKEATWYLGAVLQRTVGGRVSARMAGRVVDSVGLGRLSMVEGEFVLGRCCGITEE